MSNFSQTNPPQFPRSLRTRRALARGAGFSGSAVILPILQGKNGGALHCDAATGTKMGHGEASTRHNPAGRIASALLAARRRGALAIAARCAGLALAIWAAVSTAAPALAQDDWQVVEQHHDSPQSPSPSSSAAKPAARGGVFDACGEKARAATAPYTSIVAQLNDMYGANYPVYESVADVSPHANSSGCIFYNRKFLASLLGTWMNITRGDARSPMLYAIFAHEFGHLQHDDFSSSNQYVPQESKELAADQFAGYTMERLGFRRLDPGEIEKYYQLTGDDFVGAHGSHGTGKERTSAFEDGWRRAEVGLPEQGARPAGFGDQ